jgi:hypothetical protein
MPTPLPPLGGPSFNTASTPASSTGITFAAPVATNTKNTVFTELIASTTQDTAWLVVEMYVVTAAAACLVDICVGASTAETVLVPDLYTYNVVLNAHVLTPYVIPVNIPAGTRISVRCQSSVTVASLRISLQTIAPGAAGIGGLGRIEAAGVVSGSSSLTPVDAGAVLHTDVVAQLIASTGFDYKWVIAALSFDDNTTATGATWLVDLCTGAGGSETPFLSDILFTVGTVQDDGIAVLGLPVSIPAGTRLSARARSSNNTAGDRVVDVALWGCG